MLVKASFIHRLQQITIENSYDIVVFPLVLHCPCLPQGFYVGKAGAAYKYECEQKCCFLLKKCIFSSWLSSVVRVPQQLQNIQNLCIDVNVSVYILVYICPIFVESTLYIGLNVGFSYFRLREYGSNFVLVKLCALDKCAGIVKK